MARRSSDLGSVGPLMLKVDVDSVRAWLVASCAAQGVPLHVTDPAWLRSLLLRLQGGARVLSPEGAGNSAAEAAQEALEQYAVLLGAAART